MGQPERNIGAGDTGRLVPFPTIAQITVEDVRDSLRQGVADFRAAPLYGLFFGAFYVVSGLTLIGTLYVNDMAYLIFPSMAGFMLIGPITAVGLYEVSRRLEEGEALSWGGVLGAMFRHRGTHLIWLGFALTFIMSIWLRIAVVIYAIHFGSRPLVLSEILTSSNGISFLIIGNGVGAAIACFVFAASVVSVPFLLDKNVDFLTAIIASVRSFFENQRPMIFWAGTVVVLVALGMAAAFVGLVVVLPIIGHATWHLYRRALIHKPMPTQDPPSNA